jgi:hypothetical protein
MNVDKRFTGRLIQAEGEPQTILLEEGVYQINQRNELTWKLSLQPGERRGITYKYEVLVRE